MTPLHVSLKSSHPERNTQLPRKHVATEGQSGILHRRNLRESAFSRLLRCSCPFVGFRSISAPFGMLWTRFSGYPPRIKQVGLNRYPRTHLTLRACLLHTIKLLNVEPYFLAEIPEVRTSLPWESSRPPETSSGTLIEEYCEMK